jgi:hypothetical protein
MSVFKHARQSYDDLLRTGDEYDRVYCVIDKDKHTDYQEALKAIAQAKPANRFYAITSVPCFEYWLLLHFLYTTQPFEEIGNKSICDCVGQALRDYLPNYQKGTRGLFVQLFQQLNFAKVNAIRALNEAQKNHTDNPSTHLHELIEYLQTLNQ